MKRFLITLLCCVGVAAHAQSLAPNGPELAAWLIGVDQNTIATGEPLRIGVEVSLPAEKSAPLTLTAQSDDWRRTITVELLPKNGGPALGAQPVRLAPEKSITVAFEEPARGMWWISSHALAALPAGDYEVRVRLSRPALTADPVTVTLSGQAPAADSIFSLLAKAHEDVLEGNPEAAAKRVDAVLEKDASSVALLVFRAQLALSVNDVRSARACLRRARLLNAQDLDAEPSVQVEELLARLNAPATGPASTTPPPAWSVPPALVFAAVAERPVSAPANAVATKTPKPATPVVTPAPVPTPAPAAPASSPVAATSAPVPPVTAPSSEQSAPAIRLPGTLPTIPAPDLTDIAIIADPNGQWAATAKASSQYGTAAAYSAMQATGVPNVPYAGNDPGSWCPANKASGTEWLEVSFAKPANAVGVRIRQNNAPGAIAKIEAIDTEGHVRVWWQGKDPYVVPRVREIAWLGLSVPRTDYLVASIRLTLDLSAVTDWTEIDAVQLVTAPR